MGMRHANGASQACPLCTTLQLNDHGAAGWISAVGRLAAPDGHPVQPLWGFPFQSKLHMCSEVKTNPTDKGVHVCPGRKVPADFLPQLGFSLSFSYQPHRSRAAAPTQH